MCARSAGAFNREILAFMLIQVSWSTVPRTSENDRLPLPSSTMTRSFSTSETLMLPEPSSMVTDPETCLTLMLPEPSTIDTSPVACSTSMEPEPSSICRFATFFTSIEPEPSSMVTSPATSTTSSEPEPSSILIDRPFGTLTSRTICALEPCPKKTVVKPRF